MDAAALPEIALRHGLTLVLRFGSTVTGRTHPGSDIDLGIPFERIPERLDAELAAIADLQAVGKGSSRSPTARSSSTALTRSSTRSAGTRSSGIR